MKRVTWSEQAAAELQDIVRYIANENPIAAARVAQRIRAVVSGLRRFNTGRVGRVSGTFEKVVSKTPYIIAYELRTSPRGEKGLYVLHIIHGARDWPEGGWP